MGMSKVGYFVILIFVAKIFENFDFLDWFLPNKFWVVLVWRACKCLCIVGIFRNNRWVKLE